MAKPFIQMIPEGDTLRYVVEVGDKKYALRLNLQNNFDFSILEHYCTQVRLALARHIFSKHHIHLENIPLHFTLFFDRETNLKIITREYTKEQIDKLFSDINCLQYRDLVPSLLYKK